MWGEWLVFGTALGVGNKVAESMKEFGVILPEFSSGLTTSVLVPTLLSSSFKPVTTYSSHGSGSGADTGVGEGLAVEAAAGGKKVKNRDTPEPGYRI
jgi:uncharacterized membrane protein